MSSLIENIIFACAGVLLAMLGAAQPGLVNLTVAKKSWEGKNSEARLISHGAAIIEVVYGIVALFAGKFIHQIIGITNTLSLSVSLFLVLTGVYFLVKQESRKTKNSNRTGSLLSGMLLNFVSIQVFIYWLLLIGYLQQFLNIGSHISGITLFLIGIYTGKILTLELYQHYGKKTFSKVRVIRNNTNKLIGVLFIVAAIIQQIKF